MAFSKARRLSDFIAADGTIPTGKFASGTITSTHIADGSVAHADLHTDMNLTSKTVLVANASTGDSDTTAANTAFVQQEIAALVDSSPGTLNTLNELAAALGDDANFSTTVTNSIATKLPLAGGTLTGDTSITKSGNPVFMVKTTGAGNNPVLRLQADTNKWDLQGTFSNTNDELFFMYNGSTKMAIDSLGNVGIGTSSITNNTLGQTTYFGNSTSFITGDSSSARFWLGNNWYYNSGDKFIGTGYANLYTQQSGNHEFLTSTASGTAGAAATFTSVLKIDSSGNVGIGTNSPNANFQVLGPASATVPAAGSGAVGGSIFSADLNTYGMHVGSITNGKGYIQQQRTDTATYYDLLLQPNGGQVGIGTDNPTVGNLHVVGGIYSTTSIQGDNAVAKSSNSLATFGSNSAGVGIALARDADATTYPDLVVTTTGAVTVGSQGNVIGAKWLGSHENLYWNSKFIYSGGGYGSAPDKWITQGGNVTITSEHPYNKGFSTSYTNTQSASHTTNINNATPSTPHWKGVYTTFSGATNFGGNQNSSIGGGWENGEGALMKCVYNGSGASNSTNAIRGYQWKNFFSEGKVHTRQSFFYFLESGEFSSGYFAGYAGQYGSDYTHGSSNTESSTGQHRHTTTGQWVYVNHACGSYLGATFNNASQGYMHGFGFRPGYATTVWIAIPGLTAQVRDDGKTINIHSAQQQIGQG